MLLRFWFSNYRSFRDEQELTLTRNRQVGGRAGVQIGDGKEFSLPVCGIYGSNASGKSNLLKALQFVQGAVQNSHRLWEPGGGVPLQPFRLGGASAESEFALDFLVGGVRYQFGFAAGPDEVTKEWLYSYPAGKRKTAYVREKGGEIEFGRTLAGDKRSIAALMRKNSLFLSTAAQNNHEMLSPIYRWFQDTLLFSSADVRLPSRTLELCAEEKYRERIAALMAFADMGIADIVIERAKPGTGAPTSLWHQLYESLSSPSYGQITGRGEPSPPPNYSHAVFDLNPFGQDRIALIHKAGDKSVSFNSEDESDGTRAYLAMLGPIISVLETGSILVVDEIDSSLHPNLTAFLVRLFSSARSNPRGAQLVFTTHDTTLLDNSTPDESSLTRDEIWLVQKDQSGASSTYPLSDFKPVKGENISRSYLAGRFGSVPFINSERIIERLRGHVEER